MKINISSFSTIFTTVCILESFNPASSFIWTDGQHPDPIKSISSYIRRPQSSPALLQAYQNDSHNRMWRTILSLVPEENPYYVDSTVDIQSKLFPYTSLNSVSNGLDLLYPPKDLEKRNSISRTDGYWAFIQNGENPPPQYTYGEFDFYFFSEILDAAYMYYKEPNSIDKNVDDEQGWKDKVFCDMGSGTGRLVLAAAALHPGLKLCQGVEILEGVHSVALETLEKCRSHANLEKKNPFSYHPSTLSNTKEAIEYALPIPPSTYTHHNNYNDTPQSIPLAPIQFTQGSFSDPYLHLSNVDIAFVFSSAMDPSTLSSLSQGLGRQCRPGSILITTDYPLVLTGTCDPEEDDPSMPSGEYEFEIVDQIDGYCWLVGGVATAYIHVVKKSLYEEYGKEARVKPEFAFVR